jgi:hypothetical protein
MYVHLHVEWAFLLKRVSSLVKLVNKNLMDIGMVVLDLLSS